MRALERDPEARQPSAAELGGELERFRSAELGGIRRRGIGARAVRERRLERRRRGLGAAAWTPSDDGWDPQIRPSVAPVVPMDRLDDTDTRPTVAASPRCGHIGAWRRRGTRGDPAAGVADERSRPLAIAAGLGLAALSDGRARGHGEPARTAG